MGEELDYAAELINRIIEGIDGPRIGIHICRGNWSTREDVLLTGDYTPLLPALTRMRVHQYVLEYATPRAGDIAVVGQALSGPVPGATRPRELGLGVVNPRTREAESPEWIIARAEKALAYFTPETLFLNTDCGFGCFSSRCVNDEATALAKIVNIVRAARSLREKFG